MTRAPLISRLAAATALALLAASPALADSIFTPPLERFPGRVAVATESGAPIVPGSEVVLTGEGLPPGQQITLMRGTHVLNEGTPLTVDPDGKISFRTTVDEGAAIGRQPVVVIAENPAAATVVDMKVSPQVAVTGAENFDITSKPLAPGLYQIALGDEGTAYVTSAVGRPPVKLSKLLKIDTSTMEQVAAVEAAAAPAQKDGSDSGVMAVYGVAYDPANKHVWVTNTRQDTVAVYDADDLSLVKQFDAGAVPHARDVTVDPAHGRAYASAAMTNEIKVFDLKSLEPLEPIKLHSSLRGETVKPLSLDLDPGSNTLFTVSVDTPEAAVVDLATGEARVIPLSGVVDASGVAHDPRDGLIFVASQGTDNLQILKAETGELLHDVKVGAGPLNVTFEPVSRLAFVANRGSGTITAVDTDGRIVANLDAGSYPNHLVADGKGAVWAVNKARGENDPDGDRIWLIKPKG